ncbi:MAG TPA: SIR2 family protein, partial [Polyangiaceae bacterium]|nr:SIR2 family protein [Polyangiaceae bacterium]
MKTPLDPLVALSFAVQSNPGVYAVLLGSGISKAAQIPTGWDVLVDLTRRVALASGVPDPTDPEAWYHDTFGEDPSYSALLQRLGKTRAERRALLHAYFEPTPEEEAQGRKQPTAAHKAIARLAGSGHIRVVLTTNFDRLMERSLEAEGIQPLVISASGGIDGATPLRHAPCTVIKVHGDYQDARIKNTPDELASFDPKMKRLLAQVLDEYGLIVCGWSAEWDTGLRSCIEAARSRRYTTFWAARSDLTDAARRLVKLRDATLVPTTDADQFFGGLADKVDALTQFAAPHPLSPKIAEATLKQHLSEPDKHRIRIHDLIHAEVDRVIAATRKEQMPLNGP